MRISFLFISSSLWSVARDTVTPPTCTGLRSATGVIAPVLPTWVVISNIIVVTCCAGNLYAMAQRGYFVVEPSSSRCRNEFIFITIPSMSYPRLFLFSSYSAMTFATSSKLVSSRTSWVLNPSEANSFMAAKCESACGTSFGLPFLSVTINLYTNISSGREAVILESNKRSEPAAALRGFAKRDLPSASRSAFILSNASRERYTSPRTSNRSIPSTVLTCSGMEPIVLRFAVISSPLTPSPRVAPRINTPSSYISDTPSPSILGSMAYSNGSSPRFFTILL